MQSGQDKKDEAFQREKADIAYQAQEERRMAIFNNELAEVHALIDKTVSVKLHRVYGDRIAFEISNNSFIDVKSLKFSVVFKNAFGDVLNYEKQEFKYEAISPDDVIAKGIPVIATYDLNSFAQALSFDIFRYKEHLFTDTKTDYFVLTTGEFFPKLNYRQYDGAIIEIKNLENLIHGTRPRPSSNPKVPLIYPTKP